MFLRQGAQPHGARHQQRRGPPTIGEGVDPDGRQSTRKNSWLTARPTKKYRVASACTEPAPGVGRSTRDAGGAPARYKSRENGVRIDMEPQAATSSLDHF